MTGSISLFSGDIYLPIINLTIEGSIINRFAKLEINYYYFNPLEKDLEVFLYFPSGFFQIFTGMKIDDKPVDAIKEDNSNFSKIEIGKLLSKKTIKISLSYIETLENTLNKKYKLNIPLGLTPTYFSQEKILDSIKDMIYIKNENEEDIKILNEMKNNSNIKFLKIKENSYDLFYIYDININLFSSRKISKISSNNANIILKKNTENSYKIILDSNKLNYLKTDTVIEYEIDDSESKEPESIIMRHPLYQDDYALFININLLNELNKNTEKENKEENLINDFKSNFLFMLERGIYDENEYGLKYAKESLIYFLKSLPVNNKFNVLAYGDSSYSTIFDDFVDVQDDNINKAIEISKQFKLGLRDGLLNALIYVENYLKKNNNTNPTMVFIVLSFLEIDNALEYINKIKKMGELYNIRFFFIGGDLSFDYYSKLVMEEILDNCPNVSFEDAVNHEIIEKVISSLDNSLNNFISKKSIDIINKSEDIKNINEYNEKNKIFILNDEENNLKNENIYLYATIKSEERLDKQDIEFSYQYRGNKYKFNYTVNPTKNEFMIHNSDILHQIIFNKYILFNKRLLDEKNIQYLSSHYALLPNETVYNNMEYSNKSSRKDIINKKDNKQFIINVKTLTGKTKKIEVKSNETILSLKYKILFEEGIPISHQHFIVDGRKPEDNRTMDDYNIAKDSTFHLVLNSHIPNDNIYFRETLIYDQKKQIGEEFKGSYEEFTKKIIDLIDVEDPNKIGLIFYLFDKNITLHKNEQICLGYRANFVVKFDFGDLKNIIENQNFDGTWTANENNMKLLGLQFNDIYEFKNKNMDKLEDIFGKEEINTINDNILITILIICFIECFHKKKKRITFILEKGKNAIKNALKIFDNKFIEIFIQKFFKNILDIYEGVDEINKLKFNFDFIFDICGLDPNKDLIIKKILMKQKETGIWTPNKQLMKILNLPYNDINELRNKNKEKFIEILGKEKYEKLNNNNLMTIIVISFLKAYFEENQKKPLIFKRIKPLIEKEIRKDISDFDFDIVGQFEFLFEL